MNSSCPKQYLDLAGKPILIHTVSVFDHHTAIDRIVVVVPPDRITATRELLTRYNLVDRADVIGGGRRRMDSVKAGLETLDDSIEVVLVHDGARPLVSGDLIESCLHEAERHGAAIAAIPVKDTLKRGDAADLIVETVDRSGLWQAQTPQCAGRQLLLEAYDAAGEKDFTDEAALLQHAGHSIRLVMGSETNLKITRPEDLRLAGSIVMQNTTDQDRVVQNRLVQNRLGHGFDAHRFALGRHLILGGVTIAHSMGLAGHSDADVVTHALCDAILGALGKGDIGRHFPDSSEEFKDIYSITLLERVAEIMSDEGYAIGNIDITIVCQAPRLAPHLTAMQEKLAAACRCPADRLNIKATTTEKMGFTGRLEGISCHAVTLLTSTPSEETTPCRYPPK